MKPFWETHRATKMQALSGKRIKLFWLLGRPSLQHFPVVTALDFDACLSVYRSIAFPAAAERVFLGSLCEEPTVTWMSPQAVMCLMERCGRPGWRKWSLFNDEGYKSTWKWLQKVGGKPACFKGEVKLPMSPKSPQGQPPRSDASFRVRLCQGTTRCPLPSSWEEWVGFSPVTSSATPDVLETLATYLPTHQVWGMGQNNSSTFLSVHPESNRWTKSLFLRRIHSCQGQLPTPTGNMYHPYCDTYFQITFQIAFTNLYSHQCLHEDILASITY